LKFRVTVGSDDFVERNIYNYLRYLDFSSRRGHQAHIELLQEILQKSLSTITKNCPGWYGLDDCKAIYRRR
jgi:hypothetical protein